jgi:alkaline phosphatase D
MTHRPTRRDFNVSIKNAAMGMALAPWLLGHQMGLTQPMQTRRNWQAHPFTLGVASGVPRPDSVVLWTKLVITPADMQAASDTGEPVWVEWEVFADEQLKQVVQKGKELTNKDLGHSVRVWVKNLEPATAYWFRFICGDATSAVGRTKTAPAPNEQVKSLRFALASCQHFEAGQYTAYKDIANQDLDFVLFVGDYIYETNLNPSLAVRQHIGEEPKTLSQYRARYEQYKSDPALQSAHAKHPWVLMWDDHEVVNDYANDLDPAYSDSQLFLERRAAAYRAYFEHQPLWIGPDVQSPHEASMRLNDHFQWGRLAELWTVDCRQFRSPHACSKPGSGGGRLVLSCEELDDSARTMLGFEQEQWLHEGLINSKGQWKFVAQATQMSSTKIPTPLGKATYTEAWDGYGPARDRFLKTLQRNQIANVVTLGGDVHMNVAANLRLQANTEDAPILASEFVTTSITSRGLSDRAVEVIKSNNADVLHMRADERGYALVSVYSEQVSCEFRTTPTPAGTLNTLSTQAVYFVDSGEAGPKRQA